jgi:hypothetical protein
MRWRLEVPVGALVLAMAPYAFAQTPIPLKISGNEANGSFELPGGIAGDLSISFEDVVGLNEQALEVSARLVDPLDSGILSRLPGPGVSVPEAFPVLIRIEPTPSSALTFAGVVSISLHTHNLVLVANSPLALYSGPVDGPLRDITRSVGVGSYRAGGSGGGFSEFMIVADTRPIDTIIAEKFDVLQSRLNEDQARSNSDASDPASIPAGTANEMQQQLTQTRTLYETGATAVAIAEVTSLFDYVKLMSGVAIPDVWRAHDSRLNVAGLRRAAAATLKFSLLVKESLPAATPSGVAPLP